MNWLIRTSQLDGTQIQTILQDVFSNGGNYSDLDSSIQMILSHGAPPNICQLIQDMTTAVMRTDPSGATQKGRELGLAFGCQIDLSDGQQQDPMQQELAMPMLGEQDKPMDMPSAEFE